MKDINPADGWAFAEWMAACPFEYLRLIHHEGVVYKFYMPEKEEPED